MLDELGTYKNKYGQIAGKKIKKTTDNLFDAVKNKDKKLVKKLIKSGNINKKYRNDDSLLHIAVRNGSTKIVKMLINNDININAKNSNGDTPLHELADSIHLSKNKLENIFELLMDDDIKLNIKNKNGNTPLHIAILEMNFIIAKLLIEEGAKRTKRNNSGKTPLSIAKKLILTMTGKDKNKLNKIINLLDSSISSTSVISAISNMVPLDINCNLNFDKFLAYYFKYNYNQLANLISYDGNPIPMVVKCKPGYASANVGQRWNEQWSRFVTQFNPVYINRLKYKTIQNKGVCWSEPEIDGYLLFLIISVRNLMISKNIKLCSATNVTSQPLNKIMLEMGYPFNINDGSDYGNSLLRNIFEKLYELISGINYGGYLVGGVASTYSGQRLFLYSV